MPSSVSSSRSHYALAMGIGIGLILPPLIKRLIHNTKSDNSSPSSNSNSSKDETTHAVRSGLGEIRILRTQLENFVSNLLINAGTPPSTAPLVARVLTYADCRGIPSHGVNRLDTYIHEIQSKVIDANATPTIEKESGCCAVIDGKNGLGAVTSRFAMNTAINLAKQHGVGIVVCKRSNHYGAAGFWANMALMEGMIGMSFTNTSPFAVPTGGRSRAVGTNPFCFFAPSSTDDDSFQLDMATTVVPVGKIEVMDRINKPVPQGWGVDRYGEECTSPSEICKFGGLYPLGGSETTGGYKGYGLGMFVEIMTSILSGCSTFGPSVQPWLPSRDGAIDYGHCFMVIDPHRFTPGFEGRMEEYIRVMRGLPGGNVKVAGDPEKGFERDAEESGVMIHRGVAVTLKSLAEGLDVDVPTVFAALDSNESRESLYMT